MPKPVNPVLTASDWIDIEKKLNHGLFGSVVLKHGDDLITLQSGFISKNTVGIKVFINHEIKGAWLNNPTELVKLFWQECFSHVYSPSKVKRTPKRILKTLGVDTDEKIYFYQPYFKSFRKLKSQYSKIDGLVLVKKEAL